MNELQNATVLHLEPPMMVHSEKGRVFHMENRRSYGLSLCLSGQITYRMAGRTVVSHPGNAVLLPRNGCYTLTGDREGLFPLLNFQTVEPVSREILVFPLQDPRACLRDFETLQQLFLFEGSRHESFSVFYSLLHKVTAAQ